MRDGDRNSELGRISTAYKFYAMAIPYVRCDHDEMSRRTMGLLYYKRAICNMKLGLFRLALRDASDGVDFNPKCVLNHLSIAICHARLGNIGDCRMTLLTVLSFMGEAREVIRMLQMAYCNNDKDEQVSKSCNLFFLNDGNYWCQFVLNFSGFQSVTVSWNSPQFTWN